MAWYMLWLGESGMVLLGGPGMVYGMSRREWHGIWYCLARYGWYMVWPGGMTCIWYDLAGITWYGVWVVYGVAWRYDMYMVWSRGHGKIYCVVRREWHGKWYGREGIAWYMYWPGEVWHSICYCLMGYGIVYGMAWILFTSTGPVHK